MSRKRSDFFDLLVELAFEPIELDRDRGVSRLRRAVLGLLVKTVLTTYSRLRSSLALDINELSGLRGLAYLDDLKRKTRKRQFIVALRVKN